MDRTARTLARLAAVAAVLLCACGDGEPVSFPLAPPNDVDARLRARAGGDARDCGVARDRSSADRVYACAADALRARQPFHCRYELRQEEQAFLFDTVPIGGPWSPPVGFAGTRDGAVLVMMADRAGKYAAWTVYPTGGKPMRFGLGMKRPRAIGSTSIDTGRADLTTMMMVEAIFDERGAVSDARVVGEGGDERAAELVRKTRFEPARFFGVPVAAICRLPVHAERGVLTLKARAAPPG